MTGGGIHGGQTGIQHGTQPYSNMGYVPGLQGTGQINKSKDDSLLMGGSLAKDEAEKQRN